MLSLRRLGDIWLGVEAAQRLRLRQTSLAMALMCISVAMLHYAVAVTGQLAGPLLWSWTVIALAGMGAIYVAIRSGWSLRWADPSLTTFQIGFAVSCAAVAYAQAGPLRGGVFPVLTLILMFGMFQLRARSAYGLSLFALVLFGVTMAVMSTLDPARYQPSYEFGHFVMLACMLPSVGALTARLSQIRRRLSVQRQELERALTQLQAIATRDDLTGLPNRRQVQALMDQVLLRSLRHNHEFCVGIVDLDHFKRVNDVHGHAAGDTVLRAFALEGQASLRATDVLARWGGEEFLVLLPDTPMPSALGGMERLRRRTALLKVPVGNEVQVQVTVSIGLTRHRRLETLSETLERADRLLYDAKATGRNCIRAD